jgi:hypothetical protein
MDMGEWRMLCGMMSVKDQYLGVHGYETAH